MIKYIFIAIVLFIFSGDAFSQQGDSLRNPPVDSLHPDDKTMKLYIEQIVIVGNDVTEPEIITREMITREKSYTDVETLNEDLQRIYNLRLFNRVDIMPYPASAEGYNLIITVEETFYILPIPIGGFKEGDWNKFWAGLNLKWRNFRGRNETLGLSFGVFYEPFINASYSIPWIGKKSHFFADYDIGYSVNNNKSILSSSEQSLGLNTDAIRTYKLYDFKTQLTFGKYLTKDLSNSMGFGYNSITTSDYQPGRTLSTDGNDKYLSYRYNINYDTRDSYEYTLAGAQIEFEYKKYGFGDIINYNSGTLDIRKFIPIKLSPTYFISLGTRINSTIFWGGNIADYHHQFFGYGKIIRGWNDYVLEGENSFSVFNELRIPVVKPFFLPGKEIPIVKKLPIVKDISYRLGLYFTLFCDVGGTWNKYDRIGDTRFINGYGAGLNFILPFGFIGRTDWAFRHQNDYFKGQLIVSLSSSF